MGNSMIEERLTQEQLAKLPIWAQKHFEMIERALESSKAQCDTLRAALGEAPLEGANGFITWALLMDDYPLPDNALVRFHEGAKGEKGYHRYIEVGFTKSSQGGRIVTIRGNDGIVIQPQAGNVVAVRVRKQEVDE